ncbi:MAG: ACT domain-containing protein [Gemmatimonadota bacterium]
MTTAQHRLAGERDLDRLLATMNPLLDPVRYAFCRRPDALVPAGTSALGIFRESEGVTLIIDAAAAERLGYVADFLARRIILTIHSDLGAVGFLARVSAALASAGIPLNAVSAAYHDHLFVPERDSDRAIEVLRQLQRTTAVGDGMEILYSVTVRVDRVIAPEWLSWMRDVHIPEVLRAGSFLGCRITHEIDPASADGRETFVFDYRIPSLEALDRYRTSRALTLQQAHSERYAGRVEATRSVRTVLAFPSPDPALG